MSFCLLGHSRLVKLRTQLESGKNLVESALFHTHLGSPGLDGLPGEIGPQGPPGLSGTVEFQAIRVQTVINKIFIYLHPI